jgi:hypothetical protein
MAARRSGGDERLDRAFATALSEASSLQSLDRRVADAAQAMEESGQRLRDVLEERVRELFDRLEASGDIVEQGELAAIIQARTFQFDAIASELAATGPVAAVVAMPQVVHDPRDGPGELENKALFLERRATQYEVQIEGIDRDVELLRERQRRDRGLADLLSGIGRFDDNRPPVGAAAEGREASNAPRTTADSTGVSVEKTADEKILELQLLRATLEGFLVQVRARARSFRSRLPRTDA